MLKPSYAELIDSLNKQNDGENEITSRYTIVIAAAKRARQIIDGDEPMVTERKGKSLSTAINELFNNKIKIVGEDEGTILHLNKTKEDSVEKLEKNPNIDKINFSLNKEQSEKNAIVDELGDDVSDNFNNEKSSEEFSLENNMENNFKAELEDDLEIDENI